MKKEQEKVKNTAKESCFSYFNIKVEDKLSIPLTIFGALAFGFFVYLNIANKDGTSWQYILGAVLSGILFLYEFNILFKFIKNRIKKKGDFAATLTHDELIYVNRNDASQEMHHIDIGNIESLDIENKHKDIYGDVIIKLKDQQEPIILIKVYNPDDVIEVFNDFLNKINQKQDK